MKPLEEMVSEFMCPCPDLCGKALEVCECSDAAVYIKEISDMQAVGLSAQVIRDKFVEKYGPSVMASPPAEGFGLLAYAAPLAVVLMGVAVAAWTARKWSAGRRAASAPPSLADMKQAEEEIKKWN